MRKIKNFIFISLILLGFTACEDLLETNPRTSVSEEIALGDVASIRSVLMGAYNVLQNYGYYGRDFIVSAEILADNVRLAEINSGRFDGQEANDEGDHISIWDDAYQVVTRCNNVLAAIDKVDDGTDAEKDAIKGQAYFLRALAYSDLLRVYSREPNYLVDAFDLACPIVVDPVDMENGDIYPKRNNVSEVYIQVEADLEKAIALLDNSNGFPFQASQVAAKALLARVYLYQEKWPLAALLADEAIAESPVDLVESGNYVDAFKQGAESLFELPFAIDESHKFNSLQSIYIEDPVTETGYGDVVLTDNMLSVFQSGDDRLNLLQESDKGGEDVYFVMKYAGYGGGFGVDNIALIRLSELYLISAEAHVENNEDALAHTAINILRAKRNLPDFDPALVDQDLLDSIMLERRIELAFEGHRIFDLKRKGSDILKDESDDNLDWDDFRVVAKIPTVEIDVNTNLEQNPGY